MDTKKSNWNYPTTIWFGVGRIKELPLACSKLGLKNPLFVTDKGLVKLDFVQDVISLMREENFGFTVYNNVQGNPTVQNVLEGVDHFRRFNHDGVIAFGGGSAMDAAKTIAFMVGQTRSIAQFEDIGDNWTFANEDGIVPIIAIPTTSGTGSEVGRAAVILDEVAYKKKIIFHPKMMPSIVISDPELTVGLPPNITAWTGVDAFVHAIEAYCAPGYHPMADGIALEAMKIVAKYLPIAFDDGGNLESRGQMLVAASMGATAFQKGLGSVHSVAHQLGAIYNKQHGLLNAIILPYALVQNKSAIEDRMIILSKLLSLDNLGTDGIVDYVIGLRDRLNIPHTLAEIDIDLERAAEIGELAFSDPSTPSNAKPVSVKDLENLFRASVTGDFSIL